ncbi:hypothetical protein [Ruminococcus flavefaciens]|uniref:Lipocalin-like domain-containing protein n=1 Tax=Ruminococcus flavefaciens TaxID=1265 RepID=A0A315Y101_RUMFL|nr:hypothetical protein [Ruminococcus flavefaciens]PWJ13624.1 hypothetical protein IE37_01432 [Ruminococcus flavefaciens]SSA48238.1 hypothetical protein SAMN02910325_01432 [Ruminococcus flavefaciens]
MKKLITSIIACSLAVFSLASCGKSSDTKKKEKTADITGKWAFSESPNEDVSSVGLIFSDKGKGSVYEETTSIFSFTEDSMVLYGYAVDKEYITEENDVVTVTLNNSDVIVMKRTKSGGSGFDGTYDLTGGSLYDSLENSVSSESESADITVELKGDKSFVVFNDMFTYKTEGSELVISGCSPLIIPSADEDSDEITAEFKLDGDTLTIIDDKNSNVLTRAA